MQSMTFYNMQKTRRSNKFFNQSYGGNKNSRHNNTLDHDSSTTMMAIYPDGGVGIISVAQLPTRRSLQLDVNNSSTNVQQQSVKLSLPNDTLKLQKSCSELSVKSAPADCSFDSCMACSQLVWKPGDDCLAPYINDSMVNLTGLEKDGWFVNIDKLKDYLGEDYDENIPAEKLKAQLIDFDIKDYGATKLNDCIDRKKGEFVGPLVLQLKNWQNVSRAKISEHKENDGLCKVTLYDGFSSVSGLQIDSPLPINGLTPYGSKFLLTGKIPFECGFLLLDAKNCKPLGGKVEKLIEKWKISQIGTGKKVEKSADYTKFQPFKQANGSSELHNAFQNLSLNKSGEKEKSTSSKQFKKGNYDDKSASNQGNQPSKNNRKNVNDKAKSKAGGPRLQNQHNNTPNSDNNRIPKHGPTYHNQRKNDENLAKNDQIFPLNNQRSVAQYSNDKHGNAVSRNNFNDKQESRSSNTKRNLASQGQNDFNNVPPGFGQMRSQNFNSQPGHHEFQSSYSARNSQRNPSEGYRQLENKKFLPPSASQNFADPGLQNHYPVPNTFYQQLNYNAPPPPIPQGRVFSNNGPTQFNLPLQQSFNVPPPVPPSQSSGGGGGAGRRVFYRRNN